LRLNLPELLESITLGLDGIKIAASCGLQISFIFWLD
jgi:hypothetical protein